MTGDADQLDRMKVFVSYSRDDVAFADQLVIGLEHLGFNAILDRHDIDAAENWKQRLGGLILSCDTVVFVLTERSAASPICGWEVAEAQRHGKRIVPVVPREVAAAPPQALADLNWIHFYPTPAIPGSGMLDGMTKLDRALRVDLNWLRQQTRLSEQAELWQARMERRGDPAELSSMLLRGNVLQEAYAWARSAPKGASIPPLVTDYLNASTEAEARSKAAADAQIAERAAALKQAEEAVAAASTANEKAAGEQKRRASSEMALRIVALAFIVAGVGLSSLALWGGWLAINAHADSDARSSASFAREAQDLNDKGFPAKAMLLAVYGDPAAQGKWETGMLRAAGFPDTQAALQRNYMENQMVEVFEDQQVPDDDTSPTISSITYLPRLEGETGQRFLTMAGIERGDNGIGYWGPGWLELRREGDKKPIGRFETGYADWPPEIRPDGGARTTIAVVLLAGGQPGHERFLTAYLGGVVQLWQLGEERPLRTFDIRKSDLPEASYNDLEAFGLLSSDGVTMRVLGGFRDGSVRLWTLGAEKADQVWPADVRTLAAKDDLRRPDISAFSALPGEVAGQERFLVGVHGGEVDLFRVGAARPLTRFLRSPGDRPEDFIAQVRRTSHRTRLILLPDDPRGWRRFVSTESGGQILIWRFDKTLAGNETEPDTVFADEDPDKDLANLSDLVVLPGADTRILAAYADDTVRVWGLGHRGDLRTFTAAGNAITALAAPYGDKADTFLIGRAGGKVELWRQQPVSPDRTVGSFLLASPDYNPNERPRALLALPRQGGEPQGFAGAFIAQVKGYVLVNGKYQLVDTSDRIRWWAEGAGNPRQDLPLSQAEVHFGEASLQLVEDGQGPPLLMGYYGSPGFGDPITVKVWKLGTDVPIADFSDVMNKFRANVPFLALRPDAQGHARVLSAYIQNGQIGHGIALWTAGSGDEPAIIQTPKGGEDVGSLTALARVPVADGAPEEFLSGTSDGAILQWRIGTEKPIARIEIGDYTVRSITVLGRVPSGALQILTTSGGQVTLRQMDQAAPLATFDPHGGNTVVQVLPPRAGASSQPVYFLTASSRSGADVRLPDKYVGEVQLWRMDLSSPLAVYRPEIMRSNNGPPTLALAALPDGESFATSGMNNPIDVWKIDPIHFATPKEQVRIACQELLKIGLTGFSEVDKTVYPILRDPVTAEPCKGVWPEKPAPALSP